MAALLSGEADMALKLIPDQVDQLKSNEKARAEGAFYAGLYVLGVNSKVPPLDNPKVKQALSLAIDRDGDRQGALARPGHVPNGFVAPGDGSATTPSRKPFEFNADKAKALLAEAGYKGEEIVIESSTVIGNDRQMSEAIVEMWKKVGVNAKIEIIEGSVRAQKNREKTFKGLWWSDPTSTLQDPDGMMYRLLGPGGPMDYWREAEWDKLGEQARFSLDAKRPRGGLQADAGDHGRLLPVAAGDRAGREPRRGQLRQLAVQPEPDDGAPQGSVLPSTGSAFPD